MNMRSALYYPHTKIRSEALLKTALLLWDELHIVAPRQHYRPRYDSTEQNEAFEIIGRCHYPTEIEKHQTHDLVEDFATRRLPDAFTYRASDTSTEHYAVYGEKLLPETWRVLQEANLAAQTGGPRGYLTSGPTGLSLMSLLADCCAGKTLTRVTDQAVAYASLAGLLTAPEEEPPISTAQARDVLLPITVAIADVKDLPLKHWVALRKREAVSNDGHLIRDLRHRFVAHLESQAESLAAATRGTDQKELRRQFEEDMCDDYQALRDALKLEAHQVLGTKELIVAVLGVIATIGAAVTNAPMPIVDVVGTGGAVVAIGGLLARHSKFISARQKVLHEHPMAYLYESTPGQKI
jgi:hypothetical protein